MNNRRRAWIRELKREFNNKARAMTSFSAIGFMSMEYNMKVSRGALKDFWCDDELTFFSCQAYGIPYEFELIWKKTVRAIKVVPVTLPVFNLLVSPAVVKALGI